MEPREGRARPSRADSGDGRKAPPELLTTAPSAVALQACADQASLVAGLRELLKAEKTQLALSTAGIVVCHMVAGALKQILLVDARYGEEKNTFPPYADFMGFVNALAVCLVALLHYGIRQKPIHPVGPLSVYAGIACCATLATVSDSQIDQRFSMGWATSWRSFVVLGVMLWQWGALHAKYERRDWALVGVFTVACIVAAVPHASGSQASAPGEHRVAPEGLFWTSAMAAVFVVLYVGGDSLSQTYQDKLYRDLSMSVSDQVLFLSIFVGAIHLIGWLVGKHHGVVVGFILDHPIIIASLAVAAVPVVAQVYLMSYMLRLCGALICVMIHQVVMAMMMLVDAGPLFTSESPFRWLGTSVMVGILLYVMATMPHRHHGSLPTQKELQEGPLQHEGRTDGEHQSLLVDEQQREQLDIGPRPT